MQVFRPRCTARILSAAAVSSSSSSSICFCLSNSILVFRPRCTAWILSAAAVSSCSSASAFLPRQLLPRLATPVHGLNLQSGSLLLFPVLAQLLAGFLTPMRRLNLERGSLLFLALSLFKRGC